MTTGNSFQAQINPQVMSNDFPLNISFPSCLFLFPFLCFAQSENSIYQLPLTENAEIFAPFKQTIRENKLNFESLLFSSAFVDVVGVKLELEIREKRKSHKFHIDCRNYREKLLMEESRLISDDLPDIF